MQHQAKSNSSAITKTALKTNEPSRGKTNNVVSEQV